MSTLGYTPDLAGQICERLANGESMRQICRDEGMPSQSMVYRWLAQIPEFRLQYELAREEQAHTLADETIAIADDKEGDWVEVDGKRVFNKDHVNRSRLRVDVRKWFAARILPKKYGDRLQTEVSGPDGGPIEHTHRLSDATLGLLEDLSRIGAARSAAPPVQD